MMHKGVWVGRGARKCTRHAMQVREGTQGVACHEKGAWLLHRSGKVHRGQHRSGNVHGGAQEVRHESGKAHSDSYSVGKASRWHRLGKCMGVVVVAWIGSVCKSFFFQVPLLSSPHLFQQAGKCSISKCLLFSRVLYLNHL